MPLSLAGLKIYYLLISFVKNTIDYMEESEPKWVNPVLNIIGVNSLRLGGFQLSIQHTGSNLDLQDGEDFLQIKTSHVNISAYKVVLLN